MSRKILNKLLDSDDTNFDLNEVSLESLQEELNIYTVEEAEQLYKNSMASLESLDYDFDKLETKLTVLDDLNLDVVKNGVSVTTMEALYDLFPETVNENISLNEFTKSYSNVNKEIAMESLSVAFNIAITAILNNLGKIILLLVAIFGALGIKWLKNKTTKLKDKVYKSNDQYEQEMYNAINNMKTTVFSTKFEADYNKKMGNITKPVLNVLELTKTNEQIEKHIEEHKLSSNASNNVIEINFKNITEEAKQIVEKIIKDSDTTTAEYIIKGLAGYKPEEIMATINGHVRLIHNLYESLEDQAQIMAKLLTPPGTVNDLHKGMGELYDAYIKYDIPYFNLEKNKSNIIFKHVVENNGHFPFGFTKHSAIFGLDKNRFLEGVKDEKNTEQENYYFIDSKCDSDSIRIYSLPR